MTESKTTTFEWKNELGSRSRKAWLLLIKDGVIHEFIGESLPGVAVVTGKSPVSAGKWSHTVFQLRLAPGVNPIPGRNGWETGGFTEGLAKALLEPFGELTWATWERLWEAAGVGPEEARRWCRAAKPKIAERFDQTEQEIASLL